MRFPLRGLRLLPAERADYYRWLFFAAGPVEDAVTRIACGMTPPPEPAAAVGYGSYKQALDTLEYAVSRMPFITGTASRQRICTSGRISGGMQFGTIEKRPAFEADHSKLKDRPAALQANALDDAAMPKQG